MEGFECSKEPKTRVKGDAPGKIPKKKKGIKAGSTGEKTFSPKTQRAEEISSSGATPTRGEVT